MKYLIQNRKEFAISVGFFVMATINFVRAIRSKDITEEVIIAVVFTFFGVLAWFYNMPTSEENCIATGEMRLAKQQNAGDIPAEDFREDEEFGGEDDAEL